ncbi:MAG: Ig-like domain-containing protein [Smithella sp.]
MKINNVSGKYSPLNLKSLRISIIKKEIKMEKSRKRSFFSFLNLIILMAAFALIVACGGSTDSGSDTGDDTTNNSSITLTSTSNSVSYGNNLTLTATVRDEDGNLLEGALVAFTASSALVDFSPVAATDLTDSNGQATITITPASTSGGAITVTASASVTIDGTSTTITSAPLGISIGDADVTINSLTAGTSSISAYGTTTVGAEIYVGGTLATVPISVTFNSTCVGEGKATISSPVTTVDGVATATYKDNGCGLGSDTITATVTDDTENISITVSVPATNNIQFTSAEPEIIGTSTASSSLLPTSSLLTFRVLDINGSAKSGVGVTFTMLPDNYADLGISFTPTTATSDSDGYVTTSVSSGTVPTPAWVVASITATPTIRSQSNTLVITTGLPTQNSFSLSTSSFNIEGWIYDGITSTLTIIASDRMGNPVPDGTAISFTAEGAQITPGTCQTSSGTCSVTFKSADSRPTDGRVTVLAYALGEESFVDLDGDNAYDSGETYVDLGIPFTDDDFDGVWDSGEDYLSTTSGSSSCPAGYWSKTSTCNGSWGQNYVRESFEIILSGSDAYLDNYAVDMQDNCTASFELYLKDVNNNPMPAGTTVSVSDKEIYYVYDNSGTPVYAEASEVTITSGSPVRSSSVLGGTPIVLKVKGGTACNTAVSASTITNYPYGSADIKVTTPKGNIKTISVTVTGDTVSP